MGKNLSPDSTRHKRVVVVMRLAVSCFLAALWLNVAGCATTPRNSLTTHDSSKWEAEIKKFEASDQTNRPAPGGIVFSGSSSIRRWTNLVSDFPDFPVVNRGFGGSQLADVVNYADRIIIPYAPREVIIYCGGNDIDAKKTVEVVYGDFAALMTKLHAKLPHTKLVYISNGPNPKRWSETDDFRRLNTLTENYCRHHDMDFINVFPLMLGPDGLPKPDIYVEDKLHMNSKGYAIWKEAIRPYLIR